MENCKNILKGTEYRFIRTNEYLGRHVILLGLAGSYSYGTNIETSDIDITDYPVVTLCGSTHFKEEFMEVQKRLTYIGREHCYQCRPLWAFR